MEKEKVKNYKVKFDGHEGLLKLIRIFFKKTSWNLIFERNKYWYDSHRKMI